MTEWNETFAKSLVSNNFLVSSESLFQDIWIILFWKAKFKARIILRKGDKLR